jgi:Big-like domain-containing protein
MRSAGFLVRLGAIAVAMAACEANPAAPASPTAVASVAPVGGSTGVSTGGSVTVTFTAPMRVGMEMYAALHQGTVTGPVVPGAWMWSGDRTQLTFTPTMPLQTRTAYTLHLGGGMLDSSGAPVDYQSCVDQMGGAWATPAMMGGGMMGGGDSTMMGQGWKGSNGMYGMTFPFTTGATQ